MTHFGEKRKRGKNITHFSVSNPALLPSLTLARRCFCPLEFNTKSLVMYLEEGRVWVPLLQGCDRVGRGKAKFCVLFRRKGDRYVKGNIVWIGIYITHSKAFRNPALLPFPSIQPMKLFWLWSHLSPSLSLCSVALKYVTLKGINCHFLSCLTEIRRRNCLKSNGYEMDF